VAYNLGAVGRWKRQRARAHVDGHRALLFLDPGGLVVGRKKRVLQAGLPSLAVADEHQPQLMHGDSGASAKELQHRRPSLADHLIGRHNQICLQPSVGAYAGRGPETEIHLGKLRFVEKEGDKAAHADDVESITLPRVRQKRPALADDDNQADSDSDRYGYGYGDA
jgi:hypothetical protein